MVMGGKGLRSCETLDTIDNSADCTEADATAVAKQKAAETAHIVEKEMALLVEEAVDALPSLRSAREAARVAHENAKNDLAPDVLELGDAHAAAKQALEDGRELEQSRKREYKIAVEARKTAEIVAAESAKDAKALRKVWTPLADMISARFEAAYCQTTDSRILAFGGEDIHCRMQNTCEVYEPANDTWRPLPEGQLLIPTTDFRSSLLSGGFSGGAIKEPDIDQEQYARDRPASQQFGKGTKAARLAKQYDLELDTDQSVRDRADFTEAEEHQLINQVHTHPGGTEAEWKDIATNLGTRRSWQSVERHFLEAHPNHVFGLDGKGRRSPKGAKKSKKTKDKAAPKRGRGKKRAPKKK